MQKRKMLIYEKYIYYIRWKHTTLNARKTANFRLARAARKPLPCGGWNRAVPAAMLIRMLFTRHRSRALLPLLACGMLGTAPMPAAFSATTGRATLEPTGGRRFLDDLAQAERRHDYRPLLAACDRQVAVHPDDRESYRQRALARWGARQYDGALADFERAIDLARRQKAPVRLLAVMTYGRALIRREQHDTAAEAAELERAARADRSFTDALNDLAWIRATNPDASLRNGRQAVDLARHACETVPGSVKYLDTLAAAYAEAGDAKRAADTERAAIKAAHADARTVGEHREFLASAQGRVDLYASGGQYREDPNQAAASRPKPADTTNPG